MRISELGRRSGVPVTTIKFYIREGLLPAGAPSQRNQADYDATHLERLDLIRALRDVAGLSLEVVREVLEQVDKPAPDADPVGAALQAIYRVPERDRTVAEQADYERLRSQVDAQVRRFGWVLPDAARFPQHLNVDIIADSVAQLRKHIAPDFPLERLEPLAALAWQMSEVLYRGEEDRVPAPGDDLVDPTRTAVLGTLLFEPIVTALLRSALAMRSMHLSAGGTPPA